MSQKKSLTLAVIEVSAPEKQKNLHIWEVNFRSIFPITNAYKEIYNHSALIFAAQETLGEPQVEKKKNTQQKKVKNCQEIGLE